MTKVLVLAAMMAVQAGAQSVCPTHKASCDSRAQLATSYIYGIFGQKTSALDVWLENAYDDAGRIRIERRQNHLERLAIWAKTLPPEDSRAYLAVIEFYEDGQKDAYAEWHTHSLQRRQAAFEKHLKECAEAAKRSAAERPLPKPPISLESAK